MFPRSMAAHNPDRRCADVLLDGAALSQRSTTSTDCCPHAATMAACICCRKWEGALSLPSNEAVRSAVLAGGVLTAVSLAVVEDDIAAGRLAPVVFDLPERAFRLLRHKERYRSKASLVFEEILA